MLTFRSTLNILRILAFLYSAFMLAAIEYVGIESKGRVELEADRRDVYSAILFVSASSFFTNNNANKDTSS